MRKALGKSSASLKYRLVAIKGECLFASMLKDRSLSLGILAL